MDNAPATHAAPDATEADAPVLRCPIDHTAMAPGCPVMHDGSGRMSKADMIAHSVLRIPPRPAELTDAQAYSAFQRSMLISALRCTLTYVIFPFVLPAVGFAKGVGPIVGITISVIAITFDVLAIRRFHIVGHRWRWHFTAIASCIIALLFVLMVQDFIHLLT
jgi:hypothetical protein